MRLGSWPTSVQFALPISRIRVAMSFVSIAMPSPEIQKLTREVVGRPACRNRRPTAPAAPGAAAGPGRSGMSST